MTLTELNNLVDRMRDHAEIHEAQFPQDEEQRQWAKDLRSAANELERLRTIIDDLRSFMPPPAEPTGADVEGTA